MMMIPRTPLCFSLNGSMMEKVFEVQIKVAQKTNNFDFFKKNMKYVSYMNYLRPMIFLGSLKTPPRLCTIDFNFTKDFAPKYKGNNGILVFWRFLIILFLWNDFKSHRSFCLIDTLLLIPILPQFMTFYVIWHMSRNAIKCHFMAFYDTWQMT